MPETPETAAIRANCDVIDATMGALRDEVAALKDQNGALQHENAQLKADLDECRAGHEPGPEAQAFIGPDGTGDGSSREQPAALTALDTLVEKVGPGGKVLFLTGNYKVASVLVQHGGAEGNPVTISCEDGAVFEGNRNKGDGSIPWVVPQDVKGARNVKQQPMWGNTGNNFIDIKASHLIFEKFQVRQCAQAFDLKDGCDDLTFRNINLFNCQDGFYQAFTPAQRTTRLRFIENTMVGFSKSAIRLDGDTNDVWIMGCVFDSGFQSNDEFADAIKIGSSAASSTGSTVHNVHIDGCKFLRCIDIESSGYWNGDGSSAETGDYNLLYEDCEAAWNSDGGIDTKASPTVIIRPNLHDNKNNIRAWHVVHVIDGKAYNNHKIAGAPYGDPAGGSGGSYNVMVIGGAAPDKMGGQLYVWGTFEGSWSLKAHDSAGGKVYNAKVFDNRGQYPSWYDQETGTIKEWPTV